MHSVLMQILKVDTETNSPYIMTGKQKNPLWNHVWFISFEIRDFVTIQLTKQRRQKP